MFRCAEHAMKSVLHSAKQNFTAKQSHAAQRHFTRPSGRISLTKNSILSDAVFCLERDTGVEPAYAAWEAAILPMN